MISQAVRALPIAILIQCLMFFVRDTAADRNSPKRFLDPSENL